MTTRLLRLRATGVGLQDEPGEQANRRVLNVQRQPLKVWDCRRWMKQGRLRDSDLQCCGCLTFLHPTLTMPVRSFHVTPTLNDCPMLNLRKCAGFRIFC